MLLGWLATTALLVAQTGDLYSVERDGEIVRLSADRAAVSPDYAIRELAATMGWGLRFQTDRLRDEMTVTSLDLSFVNQGPRTVAHLIAVASGVDVTFSDTTENGEYRTTLFIVPVPTASTDSGRTRLRRWAERWYRTFLREELLEDPLVVEESMRVRKDLANLLMAQGNLEEAAALYSSIYERDRTHQFVPQALLRVAECYFELGPDHYVKAERHARLVSRMHPKLPEAVAATVMLGKLMLAQERYGECSSYLNSSFLRFADAPEIIDLYLLVGRAEMAQGNAGSVLRAMDTLDGAHDFRELDHRQWLDYLFLRGYALEALGRTEPAMEALELFLGTGPDDPRRGEAFVMLARAYLEEQRYLEARAAAMEAYDQKPNLDRHWSREASKVYAKSALEIGDKERAFQELEVEVRNKPAEEPELVIYLIEAFMAAGRFEKARMVGELLADQRNVWGDRARLLQVRALWGQARGSQNADRFPARASVIAVEIEDPDLQGQAAEIIGDAYLELGDVERASAAYRGILR